MLPIADDNRDRHRTPYLTVLFLVINVAAFLFELSRDALGPGVLDRFILAWGVVPVEYQTMTDLPPETPGPFWITLVTSMFLHGGWGHLGGNMLYLWVFGDNVEDRLGHMTFAGFYLATGIAGALAQVLANPESTIPMVGASGAISGILGAYIVFFPLRRVTVLIFWFFIQVPALVVIGLWAAMQFMNGMGSLVPRAGGDIGGVAYMAHIGGFLAGAGLALCLNQSLGRAPRSRFHRHS